MPYDEKGHMTHTVTLTDRKAVCITGVEDVAHFDECVIALTTQEGELIIRGENLHIKKLNLEGGELHVDGLIDSLSYEDTPTNRSGFWHTLFHA